MAPVLTPDPLPIDAVLPALLAALERGPNAVLVAPPGAGKTTRVPLALLSAPWRGDGKIIVLEPRRLAARAAAARMAQTLGEEVGGTVGLRVRLGSKIGPKTRIEVVTEGVFARMILDDPELSGIAAVLFDEFHERSLDADFGLALARDCQHGLREDLRILPMSATLDGARVSRLLGDAPLIRSEGRAFPIEVRYRPRDPAARIEDAVADAVVAAVRDDGGSILVFLPGQGEIRRVSQRLNERLSAQANVRIVSLYGALDRTEQDAAIRPAPPGIRKVVLATSIAETSLTIEGVRVVIDSGLARVPRYEPDLGLTRLETVRVSRASADQRAGRAGRTEPGIAYRLWAKAADGALQPFSDPEILAADLSGLVLDCAAWGVADPRTLAFLDPPPEPALKEARALLVDLQALDSQGRLTPNGKRLRALPLPPRLARMVASAAGLGQARMAAEIAALIVERGIAGDDPDLTARLSRFRHDPSSRAKEMRQLAGQWARMVGREGAPDPSVSPGRLLAFAFPDRIAKARGRPGEFLLANGRGAAVDPASALAREPYLAVAEIAGSAGASRILLAAPLALAEVEGAGGSRITEADEVTFDRAARALRARRVRRFDALVLSERPLPVPATPNSAEALAAGIAALGIGLLPWTKASSQWRERVMFLRRSEGEAEGWPDLSDDALASSVADWLSPFLIGRAGLAAIEPGDLDAALKSLLPYDLSRRLEAEAPTHVEVPTGSRIAVDYGAEDGPAIAVRVQELFGLNLHPTLAGGRVPLLLHLLSPAHRPIQITRDLPGFWRGSWADVKAQMKGRYPRHPWPDDPAAAPPTTRAKPRGT